VVATSIKAVRTPSARTLARVVLLTFAGLAALLWYQQTETLPAQPPVIGQVQEQMKREMRRGWLRVVLIGRILEVRVNGEAVLGYSGRAPRLEDVDTAVVRGIAKRAVDLYAPPRFGPPPGVDSVRIRLRHNHMLGPFIYRSVGRDYDFATSQLGR
jgi:hypothetical protein